MAERQQSPKLAEYRQKNNIILFLGFSLRYSPTMVDIHIVTETYQEANWNRQTGRQKVAQDHVLSQADALTKK